MIHSYCVYVCPYRRCLATQAVTPSHRINVCPHRWTRDSAVQMGAYLPRIRRRPWVRRLVEGAISALAFFILQVTMCPDS